MKTLAFCGLLAAFGVSRLPAQPAATPDQKTIIFVAGPKDHGRIDRHEYQKDLAVLKYCVDNMGLKNVRTQLFNGKAPGMRILTTLPRLSWKAAVTEFRRKRTRCCRRTH